LYNYFLLNPALCSVKPPKVKKIAFFQFPLITIGGIALKGRFFIIMKNIVIDNSGFSVSLNKTKLESKIEALKSQEQQIIQQLKLAQTKAKKANNLADCLATAEKFAKQFLVAAVEKEKTAEPTDNLEQLISNKVEFGLKFEAGTEVFQKLILENLASQVQSWSEKLAQVQSQIQHQERKFTRLQARRQGKILLDCEYRKSLGCFGNQCSNCQVNYKEIAY